MKTLEQLAKIAFEAYVKHTAGFATWSELSDNVRDGWAATVQCVLAEASVGCMNDLQVSDGVDDLSVIDSVQQEGSKQ